MGSFRFQLRAFVTRAQGFALLAMVNKIVLTTFLRLVRSERFSTCFIESSENQRDPCNCRQLTAMIKRNVFVSHVPSCNTCGLKAAPRGRGTDGGGRALVGKGCSSKVMRLFDRFACRLGSVQLHAGETFKTMHKSGIVPQPCKS